MAKTSTRKSNAIACTSSEPHNPEPKHSAESQPQAKESAQDEGSTVTIRIRGYDANFEPLEMSMRVALAEIDPSPKIHFNDLHYTSRKLT
jgi:hypothetical protein